MKQLLASVLFALLVAVWSSTAIARPDMGPEAMSIDTDDGYFRVHYTLETRSPHHVRGTDENPADGVPDYVNRVIEGLHEGWVQLIDREGWNTPFPDNGIGGNTRIDAYIAETDSFGFAFPEPSSCPVGSPGVNCGQGTTAYLQVNNLLDENLFPPPFLESLGIRLVMHLTQLTYAPFTGPDSWWLEATAAWKQQDYYDFATAAPEAYSFLLENRLNEPWFSINYRTGDLNDANFLFAKYVIESRLLREPPINDFVYEFFNRASGFNPPDVSKILDAMLEESGGGLQRDFQEYSAWLYLACLYDDGAHFKYGALCTTNDGSVSLSRDQRTFQDGESVPEFFFPPFLGRVETYPTPELRPLYPTGSMGAQYYELILNGWDGEVGIRITPLPNPDGDPDNPIPYAISLIEDIGRQCDQPVSFSPIIEDGQPFYYVHVPSAPLDRLVVSIQNLHAPSRTEASQLWYFEVEFETLLDDESFEWDASAYAEGEFSLIRLEAMPTSVFIPLGKTRRLAAVGRYSNCTSRLLTNQVNWLSGDASIAEIRNETPNKGRITGWTEGTTSITATVSGATSNAVDIEVGQPPDDDPPPGGDDDDDIGGDDDDDDGGDDGCSCRKVDAPIGSSTILGWFLMIFALAGARRFVRMER